jgi:hypothetical protein
MKMRGACLFLWLAAMACAFAAPPEAFRVTLFEGFSPEELSNLHGTKQPTPDAALSGRVTLGMPFDLKLISEHNVTEYEVKGMLTKTEKGALHFVGSAHFKTCDSSFDNTIPVGKHDFVPTGMAFSGIIFTHFVRFGAALPYSP